ncbi:STAS domain-containing protein [Streptomyces lavendofoliae]|uniref:STAS domain-containing protein n=1 Tax=Streptomyces lavendofoliae TaxID=67314 RepID=UPI003D9049EB
MPKVFSVTVTHHPDETVIAVAGEMDVTTCPDVDSAATVTPVGGRTLCLDLSEVSFIDSMGLNLLLRLRRRVRADGSRLVLTGLQEQARDLLHLTEAYALFDISDRGPAPSSY